MRFVEAKTVDWTLVRSLLTSSERENRWANFGPVSRQLETAIGEMLQLPSSRAVVAASSCTSALFALLGVQAARAGRPQRWLGSAFGFGSTRIGPLAGTVRFIDCDERGLLDLNQAARIPVDEWDGLLVTNTFGRCADHAEFVAFCTERGKSIIVDNAQCFLGCDRSSRDAPEEVISFHHTKPWGFGEGGCAIVRREDEGLFRQLLNFGYGTPEFLFSYAENGKMSDLAAAAILARLTTWMRDAQGYRDQWRRVAAIGTDAGFRVFCRPTAGGAIGFVPLIAPRPTAPLHDGPLPLARYYPPLADLPKARQLFEHMVCVASHPGIDAIDEAVIRKEMEKLISRSGS
jgi:dTDP-4-amino-4,6-dideoxygalactose transaminase